MFSVTSLIVAAVAAAIIGLAKTGLPGGGIVAIPMFATVLEGRLLPGAVLPLLIVADLFAVSWYRQHTRWDLLRPLAGWVALGFAGGISFFAAVGAATKSLSFAIGLMVLIVVALQLVRMIRRTPPSPATTGTAVVYGTSGGFTTFVSNAAGPLMNTYLAGLGLTKHELIGTSAWFYFVVNVAKIPCYIALGVWVTGGPFFTRDSLVFDAVLVPAIVVGVLGGRWLFSRIPQRAFLLSVLLFSAAGAVKLML